MLRKGGITKLEIKLYYFVLLYIYIFSVRACSYWDALITELFGRI